MNLPEKLTKNSKNYPDQEAIVFQDRRISYNQLNSYVNCLAQALLKQNIKPGDRVILALSNCPEFVIAYYAIIKIKGIVVPINPSFTRNEIDSIAKDCSPSAAIITGNITDTFIQLSEDNKFNEKIIVAGQQDENYNVYDFDKLISEQNGQLPSFNYEKDDTAAILYTPGPTGSPKGAMLTHYNLYSNAITFSQLCKMSPRDRLLLVAPVYHIAAQTCIMHNAIVSAATIIIQSGWAGPEPVLSAIDEEKVTFFFGPPTMYSFLVGYPDADKFDTSSLRIAYSGAAPLSQEIFDGFYQKYGIEITEGYGLSETSPVVTSNPIDGTKKVGSIGKPIPGVEVRIFDYEDREVPQGQVGEIVVRGPNIMAGYYNKEDETRWVMRNGWFHTGDLAYMDQDGYLYIVDRKKNVIIRGGININPQEVEEVLTLHPSVFDTAVVGVPDAVMGEEIMAFVMLRDDHKLDTEELQEYCRNKLAKYKIPRYIRFVEDLPKTTSGKLMRKEIQKWPSHKI